MTLKQMLRCKLLGKERFLAELSAHYVRTMRAYGGQPQLGEPDFLIPLLHDLVITIQLGEKYLHKLGSGIASRLDVPTWLFAAKDLPPRTGAARDKLFDGPADRGWNRFLTEPIELAQCEGDHITLQTEPNVRFLGEKLNQRIAAALARVNHPAATALG